MAEGWGGIGPQPSLLRDWRPFGVQPSVETLGLFSIVPAGPQSSGLPAQTQQYDLWVMDHPEGEGQGVGRGEGQLPGRTLKVWHVQETQQALINFHFSSKNFE